MELIYALPNLTVALHQSAPNDFTVTYGKAVYGPMTYGETARQLGICIMHALACESLLDNSEAS